MDLELDVFEKCPVDGIDIEERSVEDAIVIGVGRIDAVPGKHIFLQIV